MQRKKRADGKFGNLSQRWMEMDENQLATKTEVVQLFQVVI